jgi:hypothetical protein
MGSRVLAQGAAIAKRPPHAADSGHRMAVYKTNTVAASTAATLVLPDSDGVPFGGCWVSFVASADCYIIFGRSDLPAATAANGYPMLANQEFNWWINDTDDAYFRVIRSTADGVLTRYRSNL